MKTRFLAIIMAVVFLFPCYQGVNAASVQPYASQYLSNYIAVLTAGNSSGKINIAFSVGGTTGTTTVGVQKAMIYKSNGSYVTTVYGSTTNGLLRTSTSYHSGTYTYSGVSGTSYYAVITVYGLMKRGPYPLTLKKKTLNDPYYINNLAWARSKMTGPFPLFGVEKSRQKIF